MDNSKQNERLSILAPSLYLLNLLILPGIAFLFLLYLFIKYRDSSDPVARIQIQQNFYASIIAGIAILGISFVIILIGGLSSMYSWMVMLIYVVSIHATLVLFGALALAKGINHQTFIYPGLSRLSKDTNTG
ncbi:MAG: hypothetical protein MI865_10580 [Proteobacteria bacterium]|nr:hypothetical protein [Pseudomonadota bacterium]